MTHKKCVLVPKIALYEPDIPQNTAAIIRTCSCLGAILEIIEPCGFIFNDKRFKRVVMDYLDESMIRIYKSEIIPDTVRFYALTDTTSGDSTWQDTTWTDTVAFLGAFIGYKNEARVDENGRLHVIADGMAQGDDDFVYFLC